MVVSAGWSVPVGRGPTGGRTVDCSARGTAGVEGWRRKKFLESAAPSRDGRPNFFRPLDTGWAVCYFRPAIGIDRSASWCRLPRRGARSARSILIGEALTGRRVPERPVRSCSVEAQRCECPRRPGFGDRGRPCSAARRAPLAIVEKPPTRHSTDRQRRSGTPACCCSFTRVPHRRVAGRAGYRISLLVALVVVAADRRLGPSSSATTSTTERALPSSAVHARCWSRPTTTTGCPSRGTRPHARPGPARRSR